MKHPKTVAIPALRTILVVRSILAVVGLPTLLSLAACVVNPVTGQRELTLVSEAQEIQTGTSADQDIQTSVGLYADAAWAQYVQQIATRMTATSERPNLPWSVRVLDDPVINAYALPGGYLYVTRGILASLTSEAELAGVIGHEIGHVTARHSVRQMTRAQIAQIGLGVGSVLVPALQGVAGAVAGAGVQLLFLSYGRNDESQADELGLGYMTRQGYDPKEMAATFEMLYNASGGAQAERIPGWLSTHPEPLERRDRILQMVAEGRFNGSGVERDSYLMRLDGMTYGADPREGFFQGTVFHHPVMAFRMDFPTGWATANQKAAVQGMSAEKDAAIILTLDEGTSARTAATRFLSGEGMTAGQVTDQRVGALPGVAAEFRAVTESGTLVGSAYFIELRGRVFRVLGYAPEQAWGARQPAVHATILTFRPETDPAVLNAQPQRIRVARTTAAMTLTQFQQRYPQATVETLANLNAMAPTANIPTGTLMKRIEGVRVP